jgi:putative membrane protein
MWAYDLTITSLRQPVSARAGITMIINALFAFLHFVAAFGLAATLFFEWLTFNRQLSHREARLIQIADICYGLFAGLLLVVGFLRVFYFEKGSAFYFASPFFHLKLTLFIVVGVLSIYPTVKFLSWRKDTQQGRAPSMSDSEFVIISRILTTEMVLLVMILASASLMARGIGFSH